MSFIHSGSEIRICRVSSGKTLDGIASYMRAQASTWAYLIKNVLVTFDDDAENILVNNYYVFANSEHICLQWLPTVEVYWSQNKPCFESSHRSDIIRWCYNQLSIQRLGSWWRRLSLTLQISMDRLCRLTASLQNQKHNIQSNIFENIFEAEDH